MITERFVNNLLELTVQVLRLYANQSKVVQPNADFAQSVPPGSEVIPVSGLVPKNVTQVRTPVPSPEEFQTALQQLNDQRIGRG